MNDISGTSIKARKVEERKNGPWLTRLEVVGTRSVLRCPPTNQTEVSVTAVEGRFAPPLLLLLLSSATSLQSTFLLFSYMGLRRGFHFFTLPYLAYSLPTSASHSARHDEVRFVVRTPCLPAGIAALSERIPPYRRRQSRQKKDRASFGSQARCRWTPACEGHEQCARMREISLSRR